MTYKSESKEEIKKLLKLSPKATELVEDLKLNHLSRHLISHPESYRTLRTAHFYHRDQVDKAGVDYIVHLMHVSDIALKSKKKLGMSKIPDDVIVQAGLFHDFEEDEEPKAIRDMYKESPESVYHAIGVSEMAVDAVKAVSRKESETYNEFIDRIIEKGKENPLAKLIKYADILSNTSPKRTALIEGGIPASLDKRYKKALNKIKDSASKNNELSL